MYGSDTEPDIPVNIQPITFESDTIIYIYLGAFMNCANKEVLSHAQDPEQRLRIAGEIKSVIEQNGAGFSVRGDVQVVDYGQGSGPGFIAPLAESTLVLGAWPERGDKIDFFVHHCGREGRDNIVKALVSVKALAHYVGAQKIELSPITAHPRKALAL